MPILDGTSTWRDPKRGGGEDRNFPFRTSGQVSIWTKDNFEEIANSDSVLQDPSVAEIIDPTSGTGKPGLISKIVMEDFISISKSSMYSLTRGAGFNDPKLGSMVGELFDVASDTADLIQGMKEVEFSPNLILKIANSAGMQFLSVLSSVPSMYVQIAAQITSSIMTIIEAVNNGNNGEIPDSKLIPLQTQDTSTDDVQVQKLQSSLSDREETESLVVYKSYNDRDRAVAQSIMQYTPFFLPRFKGGWKYEWRSINKKSAGLAFQRSTFDGPNSDKSIFEPNKFGAGFDVCFGFMPGSEFCQSVIQTQFTNYYPTRRSKSSWRANKWNIRSNYKDRLCRYPGKAKITFKKYQDGKGDYDYDCKYAVGEESVWPTGLIYQHPLLQTTPTSNVGQFYSTLNKGRFNLWGQINEPGPLMYSVDCEEMLNQWQAYFETFWLTAPVWWQKYRGYGWKGQIAMLISHMMCGRPKVWDPDDETQQNDWVIGPSIQGRPSDVIPDVHDSKPHMPWNRSVFECIIKPAVMDLARRQYQFLDTTLIAYLPPRAGAYYRWGNKLGGYEDVKPYANNIVGRFYENRRALLHSGKRMGVDLRLVIDREYRQALIDSGVKWPSKYSPIGIGRTLKGVPSSVGVEDLEPGRSFTKAFNPTGGTPMVPTQIAAVVGSLDASVHEEARGVRKKKGGGGAAMIAVAGMAAIMMAGKGKGRK